MPVGWEGLKKACERMGVLRSDTRGFSTFCSLCQCLGHSSNLRVLMAVTSSDIRKNTYLILHKCDTNEIHKLQIIICQRGLALHQQPFRGKRDLCDAHGFSVHAFVLVSFRV